MQTQSDKHCAQPQHLALPTSTGWRSSARGRMAHTAVAAVMAGLLAFPGIALAADYVAVDGSEQYTDAQDDVAGAYGGTWSWDGADDMTLDNYSGTGIQAGGDLNIELVGDNTITTTGSNEGIDVYSGKDSDGNLTITGDGSLSVNAPDSYGITTTGDTTIDGARVDVHSNACGLHVDGDINIINGASVASDTENGVAAVHSYGAVNIADSTVVATNASGTAIEGSSGAHDSSVPGVSITDSLVNATATGYGHAIHSDSDMSLVNSQINASVTEKGVSSQAEAGSSSGAAIAAQGAINLVDVDFGGASVMTDSAGVSYIGNPDGSPATSVAAKNTGAASKFVNGVGRTETAETGGSATGTTTGTSGSGVTAGSARLASTGGNVAKMLDEVTAVTSDPTSMATVAATLFGGIGLAVTGIFSRKRSK